MAPEYQIPLTRGLFAICDASDYEQLAAQKWCAVSSKLTNYAMRGKPGIFMHRLIIGAQGGQIVDHINGNGLDNRRANLRLVSITENNRNKRPASQHGYKGIRFTPKAPGRPWRAAIKVADKTFQRGGFTTPEEAARAYDEMARAHFGEFAYLNFPNARALALKAGGAQ